PDHRCDRGEVHRGHAGTGDQSYRAGKRQSHFGVSGQKSAAPGRCRALRITTIEPVKELYCCDCSQAIRVMSPRVIPMSANSWSLNCESSCTASPYRFQV